ncbi:MAG: HyaD/HybD family hydrogenase maturation endopeptidase [Gammaproteobacteria bacterium]|nr:HyaD/HybD family hydrogenase maturation endopeptidase [Gammaproteobacteria bacterium]
MTTKNVLFLGIGNTLLSDEGVGVFLLNEMQKMNLNPAFKFLDGGTLSFTLAPDIEDTDYLIVLDAAKLNQTAGSVKTFLDQDMDKFITQGNCSVHEVGIADLLDIVRLTERLPEHRALVGIQPAYMSWGEELSEEVNNAIPEAINQIIKILKYWNIDLNQ